MNVAILRRMSPALLTLVVACDASDAECNRQLDAVLTAESAFTESWSECAADSDCTAVTDAPCRTACAVVPVATAHASEANTFVRDSSETAAACGAYAKSGCEDKQAPISCRPPSLSCVSGRCEVTGSL